MSELKDRDTVKHVIAAIFCDLCKEEIFPNAVISAGDKGSSFNIAQYTFNSPGLPCALEALVDEYMTRGEIDPISWRDIVTLVPAYLGFAPPSIDPNRDAQPWATASRIATAKRVDGQPTRRGSGRYSDRPREGSLCGRGNIGRY